MSASDVRIGSRTLPRRSALLLTLPAVEQGFPVESSVPLDPRWSRWAAIARRDRREGTRAGGGSPIASPAGPRRTAPRGKRADGPPRGAGTSRGTPSPGRVFGMNEFGYDSRNGRRWAVDLRSGGRRTRAAASRGHAPRSAGHYRSIDSGNPRWGSPGGRDRGPFATAAVIDGASSGHRHDPMSGARMYKWRRTSSGTGQILTASPTVSPRVRIAPGVMEARSRTERSDVTTGSGP